MDRNWKLGDDLSEYDNILDGFNIEAIIIALVCNERVIDDRAARKVYHEILEVRLEDAEFILNNNISEIVQAAKKRRE